ncbi:hypothetical protein Naga_100839g1 [Nannochloropsis gaditana]|uniref:Uncharacterized protein n=1 Tax=Nannochloropsis gaditana TaxID=72520 RepID=W7TEU3_9STRA|nr:hypothetical protein Naga_100839g1 [Nannochloropsis gaditana]
MLASPPSKLGSGASTRSIRSTEGPLNSGVRALTLPQEWELDRIRRLMYEQECLQLKNALALKSEELDEARQEKTRITKSFWEGRNRAVSLLQGLSVEVQQEKLRRRLGSGRNASTVSEAGCSLSGEGVASVAARVSGRGESTEGKGRLSPSAASLSLASSASTMGAVAGGLDSASVSSLTSGSWGGEDMDMQALAALQELLSGWSPADPLAPSAARVALEKGDGERGKAGAKAQDVLKDQASRGEDLGSRLEGRRLCFSCGEEGNAPLPSETSASPPSLQCSSSSSVDTAPLSESVIEVAGLPAMVPGEGESKGGTKHAGPKEGEGEGREGAKEGGKEGVDVDLDVFKLKRQACKLRDELAKRRFAELAVSVRLSETEEEVGRLRMKVEEKEALVESLLGEVEEKNGRLLECMRRVQAFEVRLDAVVQERDEMLKRPAKGDGPGGEGNGWEGAGGNEGAGGMEGGAEEGGTSVSGRKPGYVPPTETETSAGRVLEEGMPPVWPVEGEEEVSMGWGVAVDDAEGVQREEEGGQGHAEGEEGKQALVDDLLSLLVRGRALNGRGEEVIFETVRPRAFLIALALALLGILLSLSVFNSFVRYGTDRAGAAPHLTSSPPPTSGTPSAPLSASPTFYTDAWTQSPLSRLTPGGPPFGRGKSSPPAGST